MTPESTPTVASEPGHGSSRTLPSGSALARLVGRTVLALLGVNLLVRGLGAAAVPALSSFEPLGWAAVVATSVVVGVAAVAVGAVLGRLTDRPRRAFLALAFVGLVASLVPIVTVVPTFPGVTPGIQAIMVAMHVASAAVVVWLLGPAL